MHAPRQGFTAFVARGAGAGATLQFARKSKMQVCSRNRLHRLLASVALYQHCINLQRRAGRQGVAPTCDVVRAAMARRLMQPPMNPACVHSLSPWAPCAPLPSRQTPSGGPCPRSLKAHATAARIGERRRRSRSGRVAPVACRALRPAVAGDLDRLVELEALTNSSWNPQQIEVRQFDRSCGCRRGKHPCAFAALALVAHHAAAGPPCSAVQAELHRPRSTVLVVDEGAGPVAWAVGWAVPQELHLMNVAVHPRHQRRGHARALLTALFDAHR